MVKQYYKQILITLAIVIVLVVGVLFIAIFSIRAYTKSVNQKTIEQVKDIIDMRVEETHNIAFQMYSSQKLPSLKQTDNIFSKQSISATLDYQRTLENFSFYNKYVLLNFTVILQNQYVLMPYSGQDLQSFSKNFSSEKYPPGLDVRSFTELLESSDSAFAPKVWYHQAEYSKPVEVIPYVKWHRTLDNRKSIAVVVLMDATQMNELLCQSLATERSLLCIVNDSNQVISSNRVISTTEYTSIMQMLNKENNGVTLAENMSGYSRNARDTPWRYVLLADQRENISALNVLLMLIAIICAACFMVAIGGSVAIIRKNQSMLKPIIDMMDFTSDAHNPHDVHQALSRNIRVMLEDRSKMNVRLHEQDNVIREVYLNNLLKGDKSDYESHLVVMKELGFAQSDKYYFVVIVSFQSADENGFSNSAIQKIKSMIAESTKLYSKGILFCNISRLETALIFSSQNNGDDRQHQELIELFYDSLYPVLKEQYNMLLAFSVGGVHTGDNAIPVSFSEARLNCNMTISDTHKGISWYRATPGESEAYYYPPESEIQLIHAIHSGNKMMVQNIIRDLFEVNLTEKKIDYDFLTVFLHDFYGSILKVIKGSEMEDSIQKEIYNFYATNIRNVDSIEFQQQFLKYVYALTDSFNSNKKSHNELLAEKIMKFIEDNYDDYNLTMYRVADEFHLSSGYLSAFFKEQTGETFSEFLLSTKMKQALILVTDTDESVNTISQSIGYGSANTFCRAFRKFYGISPMEMRTSNKSKQS